MYDDDDDDDDDDIILKSDIMLSSLSCPRFMESRSLTQQISVGEYPSMLII